MIAFSSDESNWSLITSSYRHLLFHFFFLFTHILFVCSSASINVRNVDQLRRESERFNQSLPARDGYSRECVREPKA